MSCKCVSPSLGNAWAAYSITVEPETGMLMQEAWGQAQPSICESSMRGGQIHCGLSHRPWFDSQLLASGIMMKGLEESVARRAQNAPDCIPMHDLLHKQLKSPQGNPAVIGVFLRVS